MCPCAVTSINGGREIVCVCASAHERAREREREREIAFMSLGATAATSCKTIQLQSIPIGMKAFIFCYSDSGISPHTHFSPTLKFELHKERN